MDKSESTNLASPEERAKRVRYVREVLLRLRRPEFCNKTGITYGSMQNWEDARHGGLRELSVKRLIESFQSLGILNCNPEWLLYGVGEEPVNPNFVITSLSVAEEEVIAQELSLFHQLNPNAVDFIIADESMSPVYLRGDHVAGRRFFGADIKKTIGYPCIVHTQANISVLVRIVQAGSQANQYTLTCLNSAATNEPSLLKEIPLFSAAPVIWVRRKGISGLENIKPNLNTVHKKQFYLR